MLNLGWIYPYISFICKVSWHAKQILTICDDTNFVSHQQEQIFYIFSFEMLVLALNADSSIHLNRTQAEQDFDKVCKKFMAVCFTRYPVPEHPKGNLPTPNFYHLLTRLRVLQGHRSSDLVKGNIVLQHLMVKWSYKHEAQSEWSFGPGIVMENKRRKETEASVFVWSNNANRRSLWHENTFLSLFWLEFESRN